MAPNHSRLGCRRRLRVCKNRRRDLSVACRFRPFLEFLLIEFRPTVHSIGARRCGITRLEIFLASGQVNKKIPTAGPCAAEISFPPSKSGLTQISRESAATKKAHPNKGCGSEGQQTKDRRFRHNQRGADESDRVSIRLEGEPNNLTEVVNAVDGGLDRSRVIERGVYSVTINKSVRVTGSVIVKADHLPQIVQARGLRDGRSRERKYRQFTGTQQEPIVGIRACREEPGNLP